jgi:plastocyanin
MMFAVANRRQGSPRAPHRLALLALVAFALGAAMLLVTGGRASAQPKSVEIDGTAQSKWEPADAKVAVGGTVTFKVAGGPPHPVLPGKAPNAGGSPSGDNSFDASACGLDKMSTVGATCKVTFDKAGTYPYFCQVHFSQGMVGTITVGSGGGSSTGSTAPATTAGTPVVSAPSAASGTTPPKPGVYWLGYGLLAGGALLALAAVFGYLRFYPGFRRQR